jgi:Mannosyl-glycoprotein endo-beta-N-acetylglucosaminidase
MMISTSDSNQQVQQARVQAPGKPHEASQAHQAAPEASALHATDRVSLSDAAASAQAGGHTAAAAQPAPATSQAAPAEAAASGTAAVADLADKLPDKLKHLAPVYVDQGTKYNVDPKFLAAVSMHETAKGTSYAFTHKNNAMGVSGTTGPKRFKDVADSVEASAKALADPALYGKATHIKDIGDCYAPKGAANDPNDLNSSWIGGVTRNFKLLGGNPALPVVQR